MNNNSNVGSKRGKHTDYARTTSLFRKLENQLEKERVIEKKFIKREKNDEYVEDTM